MFFLVFSFTTGLGGMTPAAGTGAGKSSLMRELMYHLLQNTKHNVGVFSLEENILAH